jgi:fatty-acyl-CoA synthase
VALVIGDALACAASAVPQNLAVTLGEDRLTFGELERRSNRVANAMAGLRVTRADRVAWWSDITLDGVGLYFGLAQLGAPFVPLNPAYGDDEAAAVLKYLRPRLLIADAAHAERAEQVAKDLDLPLATWGVAGRGPGADVAALVAAASDRTPGGPGAREDDICTIFLTSGSTGRPKGVMISQRATWLRTHAGAASHITTSGAGEAVMFPLFHMAGWNFASMAWSAHKTAHLVHRADPVELLEVIERWRPATLYCIPAVWERILDCDRPTDVSSLEWTLTGTSRVETGLLERIKDRFAGSKTTVNYGSTETARAVGLPDHDLFSRAGSVGFPIPGNRGRIADDGELLITSDRLMAGYFELPDETAQALQDGWYHTGDLAEADEDGYLYIVGRKKEVIRSGGETIAPVEVEAALGGCPGVAEVAVIGIPDAHWGEVVCAVVVLEADAEAPSVAVVRAHIGPRLAPFKHPRRVVVAERIPRTAATGQIQRAALVRQFQE